MNYVTICLGPTLTPSIKWIQKNLFVPSPFGLLFGQTRRIWVLPRVRNLRGVPKFFGS